MMLRQSSRVLRRAAALSTSTTTVVVWPRETRLPIVPPTPALCLATTTTTTTSTEVVLWQRVRGVAREFLRYVQLWVALTRLCLLASPLALLVPLKVLISDEAAWRYALWAAQAAGPTVVKLSQWASSRDDRFPKEFCRRFSKLQDEARPHAWHHTEALLAKALGPDWARILDVDRVPVGSGCVAQVHRATVLVDTSDSKKGDEVAVKVVHPAARRRVLSDLDLLRVVARVFERLVPVARWISLPEAVDEFGKSLEPQMDMLREAANLRQLKHNFESYPAVTFPTPRLSLSTPDVLVEDFVRGVPMTRFKTGDPRLRSRLSRIGVDAVCKMIFHDNLLHGDLHPGNIVVVDQNRRVCFIDAGIVVELSKTQHKHLVDVLGALMRHDGAAAGRLIVAKAKTDDRDRPDWSQAQDRFCAVLQAITDTCADEAFFDHVGDYAARIFQSAADNKLRLDGFFVSTAIAIRVMEGVATALDKDVKIGRLAVPWVVSAPHH
ncbi:hypothetical protein CTAYLR_005638 [Chrysophaeum taylorii]|uniref:ABC1 atypical kinase-like domain-containing protein n=1 Tax=Chrysophaeum taylorii TaxID=2483200 RepID=A0AAD7UNR6_9STRA|nr:hypothetical protein CTAYLR_005638 [Chrysophaeum taylorii]